jgi:aminoglycoside 3-N-acetyltransferase I
MVPHRPPRLTFEANTSMARPDSYTYHHLTIEDVSRLKDLLRIFGEAFGDVETYQGAAPSEEYLAELLSKPHLIAIAAYDGDLAVGGLTAYVLDKFEQERREVYIYDLAVSQAHRRRGIATGLINELRAVAGSRGAYVIFVQADLTDLPAIRLYESLGTKTTAHHFDIEVGPINRRPQP